MSTKKDYEIIARVMNRAIYYGQNGLPHHIGNYSDTFEDGFNACLSALVDALIETSNGRFDVPRFLLAVHKDSDKEII